MGEIASRAKELGADTIVILDTHWVINAGFHINANSRFKGLFTSNEFPSSGSGQTNVIFPVQ